MSFFYYIHGLYFESDIKIYELDDLPIIKRQKPDVKILISDHFIDPLINKPINTTLFSEKRVFIKMDFGYFLIENGQFIFCSPSSKASNTLISSFIIGWFMALLFQQRNRLGFHCSALSFKSQAFLISGFSGAGKSTTSISLIKQGCKYLSDDIAFTSADDGYLIYPSFPLQKVCKNELIRVGSPQKLIPIDEKKDKFALIDKDNFDGLPQKISSFFLLEVCDSQKLEYASVLGFDKVPILLNSLFLMPFFRDFGYPISIKFECLKLASSIQVIRIKRPKDIDTTDKVCNIIQHYLEEPCQL